MKKTKSIIFIAVSAFLLMGCGGKSSHIKDGKLSKSGEKTDLTTQDGQKKLKSQLDSVQNAYKDLKFESFGATLTASNVNYAVKADVDIKQIGKIEADVGLKDFGGKVEFKAAKNGKNVDASLSSQSTGGTLSVKGTLPGKDGKSSAKIDTTLSMKGIKGDLYLQGSKVYADLSNSGNETFVKNTETFVNKFMDQFSESMFGTYLQYLGEVDELAPFYDAKTNHFKLVETYNKYLPEKKIAVDMGQPLEWPEIPTDVLANYSVDAETIAMVAQYLAQMKIDFSLTTYKAGDYGFEIAINKDSIKTILNMAGAPSDVMSSVDKILTKCSFNAAAYFNKENLLEEVGFAMDLEASVTDSILKTLGAQPEEMFNKFEVSGSSKCSLLLKLQYENVKVSFPSFNDYKVMSLGY